MQCQSEDDVVFDSNQIKQNYYKTSKVCDRPCCNSKIQNSFLALTLTYSWTWYEHCVNHQYPLKVHYRKMLFACYIRANFRTWNSRSLFLQRLPRTIQVSKKTVPVSRKFIRLELIESLWHRGNFSSSTALVKRFVINNFGYLGVNGFTKPSRLECRKASIGKRILFKLFMWLFICQEIIWGQRCNTLTSEMKPLP